MPEPVSKYLSAIDGLGDVAARFRKVVVEQLPGVEVIKKYDLPEALIYCDPPYPASTRSGGKANTYAVEMSDQDHHDLLSILTECKARAMISSYASPLYDDLLKDWRRVEKPIHVQFSNSGRQRTEILWMNWPADVKHLTSSE